MDDVERRIVMPTGALPLNRYSRYYGIDDQGRLHASYLAGIAGDLKSGERRWVSSAKDFPRVYDGGCGNIWVIVDSETGSIGAACGGEA